VSSKQCWRVGQRHPPIDPAFRQLAFDVRALWLCGWAIGGGAANTTVGGFYPARCQRGNGGGGLRQNFLGVELVEADRCKFGQTARIIDDLRTFSYGIGFGVHFVRWLG